MFKSINGGILPQRATRYSCGFDVFANEDMVIGAGETKVICLGICLDLEQLSGYDSCAHYLELHPRSSLRAKGLGGGVGIIDMDYRDEIKMVIANPALKIKKNEITNALEDFGISVKNDFVYEDFEIKRGDKIGQLILKRHEGWLLPAEYTKGEERNGGFGSTGG